MPKPRPEEYPTFGSFLWARHLWRRRTGGSLVTTAILALIVGGLSGSAVAAVLIVFLALLAHLYLRRVRD